LAALNLLLGREKMWFDITEYDFFNKNFFSETNDDAPTIEIKAILTDSDGENKENKDWRLFRHLAAGRALVWDVEKEDLVTEEPEAGKRLPAIEIGYFARYDSELGEFKSARVFPNPNEDPFEDPQNRVGRNQLRAIGFFFLPVSRLWHNALGFTSSTFKKLVSEYDIRAGDVFRQISKNLESLGTKATDDESLRELTNELTHIIRSFIPLAGDETNPGFEVTDLTISSIEDSLRLFLCSERERSRVPISRQGSGLISLQILAMLLKFGEHRRSKNQAFILAVEEPELHLYPHLQKQFIAKVQESVTQSIFTTHSPMLTESFNPEDIVILQRGEQTGKVDPKRILPKRIDPSTKNTIKRLFFVQRKEIAESLMARLCLLVEGDTEGYLLPRLFWGHKDIQSFDLLGISVISGNGSELPKIAGRLAPLMNRLIIFVDGDQGGNKIIEDLKKADVFCLCEIMQLPSGWEGERLFSEGIPSGLAEKIKKRIEESEFSKKDSYQDLFDALKSNKNNRPIYEIVLDMLRQTETIPPACSALHSGLKSLVDNEKLGDVLGFNEENGIWRLSSPT